ncbi:MAG: chromosomal replication initiator protein DnaA [Desulfobulbaceae bacterium S3730MH12]|nr:MAG: chromosomal replication initiator protein DnaA [Desulfobulbaceae bacterium S3730MH12]
MVWERVKESLKSTIAENIFNLWIEPLKFVELQGEQLYLSSPDRFFSAYVKRNFLEVIEEKIRENGLESPKVFFCEESSKIVSAPRTVKRNGTKAQMRLPSVPVNNSRFRALHPRYTFDEFMVGESNILAESACKSMVTKDDTIGPCLYINSATGLGKSHLTHAVAHHVFSHSPMTRLHYVTAKQFAAEMVRGIKTNTMENFKSKYLEHCDILLVEDVHSLTGKKKTQEELNEVLDSLIKSGKRVIITSKSAPRDLVGIDSEFRSRMTSGLVTSIQAPDVATRTRIVEKKAVQQQLSLDEEMVSYLANHIRGDVRQIESALIAIRAKARLTGGHVDINLLREVIASVVGVEQVRSAEMICDLVSSQFNVSIGDMRSRSRKKVVTFPRQVAMYLARKYTDSSLADIGKVLHRDHSTVLHSIKVVTSKAVSDGSVSAQLDLLSNKVKQL